MPEARPLVELDQVSKTFVVREAKAGKKRQLLAVDRVSLEIRKGETLALVGESGSGKTTLGRLVLRLTPLSAGAVRFAGVDVHEAQAKTLRGLRKRMQVVFQDPFSSLDPRMSVSEIVAEGIGNLRGEARASRVHELLGRVGLGRTHMHRYPHQLSGGQRQRVGIARALAVEPEFLVLDEPVSALDVSMQSQVLNLLADLRDELGLTYLFISHDLAVVRQLANRVAVMYLGQIVEQAETEQLFAYPAHPYTESLLSAVPTIGRRTRERIALGGDLPSPLETVTHCRFAPRCFRAVERSWEEVPELEEVEAGHSVACFNPAVRADRR